MIPQQVLSSQVINGTFLPPDDLAFNPLLDRELGGVALDDASQGLEVQTWSLAVSGDDIVISATNVAPSVLMTRPGTQWVSLAFDQNMRAVVAYVQDTGGGPVAKLRWYDTTIPAYVELTLSAGVVDPRLALDDKRRLQTGASDVILVYTRVGNLYFRAQRDRFTVEYLLASEVVGTVRRVGMNQYLRLQFELSDAAY